MLKVRRSFQNREEHFHHRSVSGIPTLEFAVPKGELLQLEPDFHLFPNRWSKHQQVHQRLRLRKFIKIQQRSPVQHQHILHHKIPSWLWHSRPHNMRAISHRGMCRRNPGPLLCKNVSFQIQLSHCVFEVPRCSDDPFLPSLLPCGRSDKVFQRFESRSWEAPALPKCWTSHGDDPQAPQQDSGFVFLEMIWLSLPSWTCLW